MGRHRRSAEDEPGDEEFAPKSASDLLRAAGYDLPESRRRRGRRDGENDEPSMQSMPSIPAPPPPPPPPRPLPPPPPPVRGHPPEPSPRRPAVRGGPGTGAHPAPRSDPRDPRDPRDPGTGRWPDRRPDASRPDLSRPDPRLRAAGSGEFRPTDFRPARFPPTEDPGERADHRREPGPGRRPAGRLPADPRDADGGRRGEPVHEPRGPAGPDPFAPRRSGRPGPPRDDRNDDRRDDRHDDRHEERGSRRGDRRGEREGRRARRADQRRDAQEQGPEDHTEGLWEERHPGDRSGSGPRPPGREVVLSTERRPVPMPRRGRDEDVDDRLPERVVGRRAEVVARPEEFHAYDDEEHYDAEPDDRSLGGAWMSFIVQIVVAAIGGLGIWLSFQELWRRLPYGAAGAAGLVLVGMLMGGHYIHKRRHPDEPLDLVTVAVLLIVGLVLTVSPAAFVLRPI